MFRATAVAFTLFTFAACDFVGGEERTLGEQRAASGWWVAGFELDTDQFHWMDYMARKVVPNSAPHLYSKHERVQFTARVAWWALKEGLLNYPDPISYSNCNFWDGDRKIEPWETCPSGRAWQVGISGAQVPNFSLAQLEEYATLLFGSPYEALRFAAVEAGHGADPGWIVNSTGDLRKSWLLRNPVVGAWASEITIRNECVNDWYDWCGGSWYPAYAVASSHWQAQQAIDDLHWILAERAPW